MGVFSLLLSLSENPIDAAVVSKNITQFLCEVLSMPMAFYYAWKHLHPQQSALVYISWFATIGSKSHKSALPKKVTSYLWDHRHWFTTETHLMFLEFSKRNYTSNT